MTPTPSGRLVRTPTGRELVLTRTFRAPIDDVWASITESERTARWFGSWTGEAGPGRTISVRMTFEADGPAQEMKIEACEAPRHLALSSESEYGHMYVEARLTESAGVTELRFTHRLDDKANVGDFGPGWEYYLAQEAQQAPA